ncbi:MAG: hypothetical protein ACEY3M_01865 [Wolbachia sp.]
MAKRQPSSRCLLALTITHKSVNNKDEGFYFINSTFYYKKNYSLKMEIYGKKKFKHLS